MAPIPLEGHQTPLSSGIVQEGSKAGSISLSLLIDFIIQKTYHDLTVLAELLPRKTDMERKIEIFNYASRTRQLFIRLMALVKWANSASKVDKSTHIMGFLDKQSMLFIDTADLLARISRETVVRARLPNFHIPAAIEVLTTGTYSRIPSCVKDRIVPSEPISSSERRSVLLRLNQVIQHRLVSSNLLPQMRNLKIANGRVTFHVANEFDVSLTVMGDAPTMPWRLLDIDILVEDRDTGEGKPLTHSLQVQYLQKVLQSRIAESSEPLKEVYTFLHFFCQSLQLEVYFTQTIKLCRDRLDGHINVEEYNPGRCLSVSYWRELTAKDPKSELGYTLTLLVDLAKSDQPLNVVHIPSLGVSETEITEDTTTSKHLSMEKLLVQTIHLRTKNRLNELKKEIKSQVKGIEFNLQGTPVILSLSVLSPCLQAEQLLVTVDTHTGMIQCHIPEYNQYLPFIAELQSTLNADRTNIRSLISEIRFWLTKQRCKKTLQHLPVTVSEHIPLLMRYDHPLNQIKRKMYVTFHKYSSHALVVEMKEKEKNPSKTEYNFYLINVKRTTIEENVPSDVSTENEVPKLYLKILSKVQLDTFVITHGPFTSVIDAIPNKYAGLKRKNNIPVESGNKKIKHPAYFIPELAHVVALCNDITPFTELAQKLTKRGIPHQGIQVEANATALSLKLVELPPPPDISTNSIGWISLKKCLLSVSIRSIIKESGHLWAVEFVMNGTPIQSTSSREQGMRRPIYFQYEMNSSESAGRIVDLLMRDWSQIVHLYCLVKDMMEYYPLGKFNLLPMATVKSYNYSELVLCYGGPQKQATATFQWNPNEKSFTILFGSLGTSSNAHNLMKQQLEDYLNQHQNLAQLIQILHETYLPLMSINKLPSIPHLNVVPGRANQPVMTFVTIAQSPFVLRIVYQGCYETKEKTKEIRYDSRESRNSPHCMELNLLSDGLVSIRDGAHSKFDQGTVVSEYTPTGGLKAFLSKYEDERSILRRRSQSEDDNPPSPIRTDSVDSPTTFLSHHRGPQSPIQREGGLRFHPPLTPPSNPHTPASPHPGNIQQTSQPHQAFSSSPATNFGMASPPSLTSNINPSPSMMPHPSPGSSLLASSPSNPSIHVPSPASLMPTSSPGPCSSNIPMGHSPAGAFLAQGHTDGSPFPSTQSMTSPATANWPGSPGMPRPSPARPGQSPSGHSALHSPEQLKSVMQTSRVLPPKTWAGSVPTLLSHEALDLVCTPSPHPLTPGQEWCPMERFLGCVSLKRHLKRELKENENVFTLLNTDPGQLFFKVDGLQCHVSMNLHHFQSLHMKVTNSPDNKDPWNETDLQTLESYFDSRVAAPPYKSYSIITFTKMLSCSPPVLRDLIRIMNLELRMLQMTQQQQQQLPLKWNVQFCLRLPPSAYPIPPGPEGPSPFIIFKSKIVFYLHVTRVGPSYNNAADAQFMILPVLYDAGTNQTTLLEKKDPPLRSNTALYHAIVHVKRFNEYNMSNMSNECSLFNVVQDFLAHFQLPTESPQPQQIVQNPGAHSPMMVNVQQMQQGNQMMHSSICSPSGPGINPNTGSMQYPVGMTNTMAPQRLGMGPM